MQFLKLTVLLVTACLCSICSSWAAEWSYDQAEIQSLGFVQALDGGRYEDALQSMSPLFNALNDGNEWTARQKTLRDAYGTIISRVKRRLTHRDTYVNSPDGDYIIVQYSSVFSNKSKAVESIILYCTEQQECQVRNYIIN